MKIKKTFISFRGHLDYYTIFQDFHLDFGIDFQENYQSRKNMSRYTSRKWTDSFAN